MSKFLEPSGQCTLFPENVVAEIKVLSEIAKSNGSLISLEDISSLTHCNLSVKQLEAGWQANPDLARAFELHDGFVVDRTDSKTRESLIRREAQKRTIAEKNMKLAVGFARLCKGRTTHLIALSGSTSYQSVSETDDLDFFCITNTGCLWVFLTRALLLARAYRLSRNDVPRICFSYVLDHEFARRSFASSNDPLFARDALTAIVLSEDGVYTGLLKSSPWIANHFPQLYNQRTCDGVLEKRSDSSKSISPAWKFLNQILWVFVGKYIAAKSKLLNRNFKTAGKSKSQFSVKIGADHCIFESVRYTELRAIYARLKSDPIENRADKFTEIRVDG